MWVDISWIVSAVNGRREDYEGGGKEGDVDSICLVAGFRWSWWECWVDIELKDEGKG